MVKLTPNQARVWYHMPKGKWLSAYDLQASMATLNALHNKGLIQRRGVGSLGSHYSPRTTVEYFNPPNIACSGLEAGVAESGQVSTSPASSH